MNDITIRPYQPDDAAALFDAARESVPDVYEWLPWCHPGYRIEEAKEWIADQVHRREEGTAFEFAILDNGGAYLGGCGLNQVDNENNVANLGYWIRSSAMGQGIAATAVALLASWGFEHTDLARFEIKCAIENARSLRVAEKSGAIRQGIRTSCLELHGRKHDAIVFSIQKGKPLRGETP